MEPSTKAFLFEQGGKLASDFLRMFLPSRVNTTQDNNTIETKPVEPRPAVAFTVVKEKPVEKMAAPVVEKAAGTPIEDEIAYRWECCTKHLGGAAVLLKEAYERAIGDDGVGPGTAEKVMAALNEHSGMEDDINPMLKFPETHDEAVKLLDATRKFRRAAWDCHITTGGGTVDDIEAAKMWNDMLFQEAFANAQKHPGSECIASGM